MVRAHSFAFMRQRRDASGVDPSVNSNSLIIDGITKGLGLNLATSSVHGGTVDCVQFRFRTIVWIYSLSTN